MIDIRPIGLLAAWALAGAAIAQDTCSPEAAAAGWAEPTVVAPSDVDFGTMLDQLAAHRLVFIGESHQRYEHHLNQLEIVCALRKRGDTIAIGMEFFQQPFQDALDRFVSEHKDLDRVLLETEYFMRWGFDARLYSPLLEFAARHDVPVIALNPPSETVARISRDGALGLPESERGTLERAIQDAPPTYRTRLRKAFERHPGFERRNFDHFLAVQLFWDEQMAARARAWLDAHPDGRLVVLAGGGHVDYASAVPGRMRDLPASQIAMVTQTRSVPIRGVGSVYALESETVALERPGRLGIILDRRGGRVLVGGFVESSAGQDAGMEVGDEFVRVSGQHIDSLAALRLALWRREPGDIVDVLVLRGDTPLSMRFALR